MSEIINNNISQNLYILPENNISIKEIYNLLSKEREIKIPNEYIIKSCKFKLIKIDSFYYYIKFKENLYSILLTPIEIKFFINNTYQKYEIFYESQFYNLPEELNIKYPQIIYTKNNITIKTGYILESYLKIYKETKNIYIKSSVEFEMISSDVFNSLHLKDNCTFLGISFNSPNDFDKNFYFYFPDANKTKESFYIFSSKERKELCEQIQIPSLYALKKYYGANSIGKTVTLIGTLKYCLEHIYFGTLYINCKTLDFYSKKDINICKQILIDEIIYLFYGDSENYYRAISYIKLFEIDFTKEEKNFWSLVKGLFKFFKTNKIYYISFDQYNYEVDPFNQINDIYDAKNKIREISNIKISLLTLSSLDDQGIQEKQVKILLNEKFNDDMLTLLIEIKDIIETKDLKINEDEEIDEDLEYIGRNIGNYNKFKYLFNNKKEEIDDYFNKKKRDTKEKLYSLFGKKNDLAWEFSDKLNNFLSFSVNSKYSFEQFKSIYLNIPFEYFDIYKKEYGGKEYIKIKYRYELINNIFDELYSEIVLSSNINQILFNNVFDGGAKGQLFEKLVIQKFSPSEKNNYSVNFFGQFCISNIYSVDKYVPKKNEKLKNVNIDIIMVENKPFLLKQTIFGGKAFDIIVVKFFGDQSIFFCFQITSYKKKKDLMDFKELQKNIERMISYMEKFFSFEIISVYFSYIFDYTKIYEKKIINICNILDKREIKYIFYDVNTELFYNKFNNEISDIKIDMNVFNFKEGNKIENGLYNLNNNQRLEIIKILKAIYNSEYVTFRLFNNAKLNLQDLDKHRLFCITKIKIVDIDEILMFYYERGKYKFILLNKKGGSTSVINNFSILSFVNNDFDYYKIIC